LLLRFSCSPWTLLQHTDTVTTVDTAAVRTLVLDSDTAHRITVTIQATLTIPATILITVDTAIHIMDSGSAITGHTTVMVMDIADMAAITADIVADTMADTAVDMAVVTMVDITADTVVDITADTMADITVGTTAATVDIMADTATLYRNNVRTKHLAYS
jgi:hypothetical protein